MSTVLGWSHAVSEIGESGLEVQREATPAECAAITADLEIVATRALAARYRIKPLPEGRFRLTGKLVADVEQACVVTLDPVPEHIEEEIEVEFWPKAQIAPPEEGEHEALGPDEPEPIEANRLAVGRVLYEVLASALDPYPRASGALLEGEEGKAAPRESKANPFAALANWRPKQD